LSVNKRTETKEKSLMIKIAFIIKTIANK